MRKRWSSFDPCCCGGAIDDLGFNGENPKKRKVFTKLARSGRSLRMHSTTPSQSNFSSANSKRERNDCLLASCVKVFGRATYKMLLSWSKTESQLDEILSVTLSLMVMRVGDFWATICEMRSSSSSLSLSVSSFFVPCVTSSSISSSMNDKWSPASEKSTSEEDSETESYDVLRA